MKSLRINNLKIKNPLFLAPMVEVTDLPYRLISRDQGVAMAYTEMLHINQILHENKKTLNLLKTSKKDKPLGIQITGDSVSQFDQVIPHLAPFNLVDINCGCPSLKIQGNKAGSFLLKNPKKIAEMIQTLKSKTNIPVTAKIRLGFKTNNALKISKTIEKAGADLLTVHARLATHGRDIPANHKETRKIKRSIGIPVVANGDVFSGKDAASLLDHMDGVMVARGAIGDPEIFSRILKYLRTGREPERNNTKNLKLFLEYLSLSEKYKTTDIGRIKYIGTKFLRDFQGSAKAREQFVKLKSLPTIKRFIEKQLA